ncbi:MAG: polysaccharide deacetylase family protein [Candidatus Eisenbacteria bacterium]|uniref:Polysaccharide deacetylase family protein n=1 Tax=Eiseniibacteriota bacterium TaxID=2212470 RepID=A0A538TMI5_UNCEI|nr:MAG: polysaccharide deacetylase family protein [Candidatus Eisenbacteria bacterium]
MREAPLAWTVIVLHQTPARFTAAPMGVSIPALRRVLRALLDRGHRFVGLDDSAPAGAPPGSIALTADDGYASQLTHLRPLLRELGIPWTVFVLAGMLGKRNDWDHPWVSPRERHLTPDEVRRLAGEGVTIGSHGMTHVNMTALPDAALEEELARSRETLRNLSSQPVDCVSYPWGLANERVTDAARSAGYRLGFGADVGHTTGGSAARAGASSFLISRLGLYGPDQLFPGLAAAAIGHSHPLRSFRGGLERVGQGLLGVAMASQARPRG